MSDSEILVELYESIQARRAVGMEWGLRWTDVQAAWRVCDDDFAMRGLLDYYEHPRHENAFIRCIGCCVSDLLCGCAGCADAVRRLVPTLDLETMIDSVRRAYA